MAEAEPATACWFSVKYDFKGLHDILDPDRTDLFNADCWAVVLLQHIKQHCGYADMLEPIDLMTEAVRRIAVPGSALFRARGAARNPFSPFPSSAPPLPPISLHPDVQGVRVKLGDVGKSSASAVLEARGTYVLCKVVATDDGGETEERLWTPPEGYTPPAPPDAKGKK